MLNEYKFCPLCTDPLETKTIGGAERRQCTGKECEFVFWNNPTPVLAAITHRRDEVILIQAIGWPKHWYSLVTGFHEAGETAEEGVLREVKEETGLDIDRENLHKLYVIKKNAFYYFLNMKQTPVTIQDDIENNDVNGIGWIKIECLKELVKLKTIKLNHHAKLCFQHFLNFLLLQEQTERCQLLLVQQLF